MSAEVEERKVSEGMKVLKELIRRDEKIRRKDYAIRILNQAVKYIHGYLVDYDIRVRRKYDGDVLTLYIEVDVGDQS